MLRSFIDISKPYLNVDKNIVIVLNFTPNLLLFQLHMNKFHHSSPETLPECLNPAFQIYAWSNIFILQQGLDIKSYNAF